MLEFIEVETAPNPTVAVIWLHGLGADGNDFVPVVRELDLAGCPPIRFIFPHAETMPVTINNGYVMRAWYDIVVADLTRREDATGVRKSQASIEQLIVAQNEKGIPSERIILAGFSQGCARTLQTGLRYPKKLGGLLCLSGYLPIADSFEAERSAANASIPIFLAHGSSDPIVPISRAITAREILERFGYSVEWHSYPMPHSVCPQEVVDVSSWIRQVIGSLD